MHRAGPASTVPQKRLEPQVRKAFALVSPPNTLLKRPKLK